MQEDNLTFLKRNLTTKGFDDATLHANLENQVKQGQPEFKLMGTAEFKRGPLTEKVDYELAFKKSDQSDKYFFNSFKATLKNDDPAKEMSRDFYLRKGRGFTKKEAYNLLGGRAVYKEMTNKSDEVYKAWVKLDFMKKDERGNFELRQWGQKYGYDLQKTLQNFPIKELADPELRERITASLEKGNTVKVTFAREGRDETMYIEAVPRWKSLEVYGEKMNKIFTDNTKKAGKDEKEGKEKSQDNSQSNGESATKAADDEEKGKKTGKRKGVGV
jgi:hypothetical protein